ncbi:hypothetical protein DY000_02060113 [Brassica cretica]|uniref:Uncharacterized protein n=1 Tax=Brassica cretica TaxID=69181 RepID=A0ABQ7ATG6_BRACR|nr:hypothetical protein DY000_02060113 [Brassica cretica]
MVCNQFIHFLLINEDFSPPPLTEATVYIWRQGSQEKLRSFFKQRNSSQGKQRSRRASPAPSSPTYGGGSDICLEAEGRLKTEVRRLTNISQADDCQRLGYGCFG